MDTQKRQHVCAQVLGNGSLQSRGARRIKSLAIYLVIQSKTNMAALGLRRHLGVSWRTVWLLKHKLMEAMRQRESARALTGDVRIDDAYLGGAYRQPAGPHRSAHYRVLQHWRRRDAEIIVALTSLVEDTIRDSHQLRYPCRASLLVPG